MISPSLEGRASHGKRSFFMRSIVKVLGIIAFIAVVGFAFFSCGEEDNDGDKGDKEKSVGKVYFGDTLELSGQVVTMQTNSEDYSVEYTNFTGDRTYKGYTTNGSTYEGIIDVQVEIEANEVKIKNGKLEFTIGKPESKNLWDFSKFTVDEIGGFTDKTYSKENVKFCYLLLSDDDYYIVRGKLSLSRGNGKISQIQEYVKYIYVDSDVTFSAKGFEDTFIYEDINLPLKAGWNALYTKQSIQIDNDKGTASSATYLSNPDLKWILFE
jgi:hypothetical protein